VTSERAHDNDVRDGLGRDVERPREAGLEVVDRGEEDAAAERLAELQAAPFAVPREEAAADVEEGARRGAPLGRRLEDEEGRPQGSKAEREPRPPLGPDVEERPEGARKPGAVRPRRGRGVPPARQGEPLDRTNEADGRPFSHPLEGGRAGALREGRRERGPERLRLAREGDLERPVAGDHLVGETLDEGRHESARGPRDRPDPQGGEARREERERHEVPPEAQLSGRLGEHAAVGEDLGPSDVDRRAERLLPRQGRA
jgi:hypothetical protein